MSLSREETKDVITALSDNLPSAPPWRLCLAHFTEKAGARSERQGDVATLVRREAPQHGATTQAGGHCDRGHDSDGLVVVGPVHPIAHS